MFLGGSREIPGRRKAAKLDQVGRFCVHCNYETQEVTLKAMLNVLWKLLNYVICQHYSQLAYDAANKQ